MFFSHYPIITHENKLPLYLISLGMHDCQPPVRRGTEYGFPQIFYCTKGRGMLSYDGIKTEMKILHTNKEKGEKDRYLYSSKTGKVYYEKGLQTDDGVYYYV